MGYGSTPSVPGTVRHRAGPRAATEDRSGVVPRLNRMFLDAGERLRVERSLELPSPAVIDSLT